MKAFLGLLGLGCALCAMACSSVGTGGTGGPEAGGAGAGGGADGGGVPLSGEITIKNLNVTVDKVDGQVSLTFVLENGLAKDIDGCNAGSLSASSGDEALVDPYQYGECDGFDPMEVDGVASFCADSAYNSACDYGVYSGVTTGVLEVHGMSDNATSHPWEAAGTEYTLTLAFIMSDAELVETTATAVIQ